MLRLIRRILGQSIVETFKAERESALQVFRAQVDKLDGINQRIAKAQEELAAERIKLLDEAAQISASACALDRQSQQNDETRKKLEELLS